MKPWLAWLFTAVTVLGADPGPQNSPAPVAAASSLPSPNARKAYIIPVRDGVDEPLLYLIRRGVKEAIDHQASLLVLDMDTPGGKVSTTREIINVISQFKGETVTYVNKDAFSAGAFIAVGTQKIYMAPGSVIGAAAPIIMSPSGEGPQGIPDTVEKKMTSAVRAMVRATAEKHGHNLAVVDAMIDKTRGLTIDGVVIAREGEILTLTNTEAEKEYGNPPRKLLSSGTAATLDELLTQLGYGGVTPIRIEPTGMEKIGSWLNAISPVLLIIGILGLYIEFKTPGFGVPGIVGICAFALYFLGGHAAGLSGLEWVLAFILGLALIAIELFVFPGTLIIGMAGTVLILISIFMAMVDLYPNPAPGPALPTLPSFDVLALPIRQIVIAMAGTAVGVWLLSLLLPKTSLYQSIVSTSSSGVQTEVEQTKQRSEFLGQEGVVLATLRPGGKAQFGETILDVMSQGEMIAKGARVRVIGHSGSEAIVETVSS